MKLHRSSWCLAAALMAMGACGDAEVTEGALLLTGGRAWPAATIVADADGDGVVWLDRAGTLVRLDLTTGEATLFDANDDAVLAAVSHITAAPDGGVWICDDEQLVRFDATGPVERIELPDDLSTIAPMGVSSVAAGENAIWVATYQGRLARYADGEWSATEPGHGGQLAIDAQGGLWTTGRDEGEPHLAHLDGTQWLDIGGQGSPETWVSDIATDLDGGVWLAAERNVHHWDGTEWAREPIPAAVGSVSGDAVLSVDADGAIWVAGTLGVGRFVPDDEWQVFTAAQGLPTTPLADGGLFTLATTTEGVAVASESGVWVRTDGRFEARWVGARVGPVVFSRPLAVSAEEVWTLGEVDGVDGWLRYRNGEWTQMASFDRYSAAAIAPDGSIVATTADGLWRFADDTSTLLTDQVNGGPVAIDAAGVVWATTEGADGPSIIRIDGATITSIGIPELEDDPWATIQLAAGDGGMWALSGGWFPAALAFWDGAAWTNVDLPPGCGGVNDLAVTPDGALWIVCVDGDHPYGGLARYHDETWQQFGTSQAEMLAVTPQGEVCVTPGGACYGPGGPTGTRLDIGEGYSTLAIAPDGAIWVMAEVLYRLPTTPATG